MPYFSVGVFKFSKGRFFIFLLPGFYMFSLMIAKRDAVQAVIDLNKFNNFLRCVDGGSIPVNPKEELGVWAEFSGNLMM